MSFSIPTTEISVSGKRQAHAAVALGFGDEKPAGVGNREVGAADRGLGVQKEASEVLSCCLGEIVWIVGEVFRRVRHVVEEDPADLSPVLVERRDDDVAGAVVGELDDHLGEVGLVRGDAFRFQGFDEADFLGRHRLDLDDLAVAGLFDQAGD